MEMVKGHFKKYWWCYLVTVGIAVFIWRAPIAVYGSWDFFRSIRSRFMREVLIPIMGATITFGGVAFSIGKTVKDNAERQKEKLNHEHELKIEELRLSELINLEDRKLIIKQDIMNIKLQRNDIFRNKALEYKELYKIIYDELISIIVYLDDIEENVENIDSNMQAFIEASKDLVMSITSTERSLKAEKLKKDILKLPDEVKYFISDYNYDNTLKLNELTAENIEEIVNELLDKFGLVSIDLDSYLFSQWDLIIDEFQMLIKPLQD